MVGVGATPYETAAAARAAAVHGEEEARRRGIEQCHRIVEAPTHQDALLFASGAKPPPRVLERMFGDPGHRPVGQWADDDG